MRVFVTKVVVSVIVFLGIAVTSSGKSITIRFDENQMLEAVDKDGNEIYSVVAYWFAWRSFYPNTLVYLK